MNKEEKRLKFKPKLVFDFVYSDPHFFHKNVISYCNRPFMDVQEMTDKLIENYNNTVGPEDTVLWLGDCFFCGNAKAKEIMGQLNGKKILVKGNHDPSTGQCLKRGFDIVVHEMKIMVGGHPCRVSHYPYWPTFWQRLKGIPKSALRYKDKRPPRVKGEFLLHGHSHSKQKINGKMIHVGVDAWGYKPVHISQIESLINKELKNEG